MGETLGVDLHTPPRRVRADVPGTGLHGHVASPSFHGASPRDATECARILVSARRFFKFICLALNPEGLLRSGSSEAFAPLISAPVPGRLVACRWHAGAARELSVARESRASCNRRP
jgi:hypothetical protein